ncbi:MAG: M48 family metallopeptidase [Verrucomicrobia bacterium]|nr:M48 family metallopeptidase [Verrucomicrobiota bacterium]MBU1909384.1 M48 family metallopeptidase [Verrucomicrobiota bacterium]
MKTILSLLRTALLPVLALGLVSCSTIDPVTGKKVKNLWSINDDIELGTDFYKDVKKWARDEKVGVNKDPERVQQLERVTQRIAAVSHLPGLPYEVILLHTNEVNAMALPGGKLIVLEGLYDPEDGLVRDEDELAAVLAHEIAHVNCRHSTEELTRNLPWELLLLGGALYAEAKDDEDLQAIFGGAFLFYQGLIVTKYSRKDEREADRVGLMYMARAGYDPRAALRLWQRAAKEESKFNRALSFLSTHPSSKDRARDLEEHLPEALAAYEAAKASPTHRGKTLAQDPGPDWVQIKNPRRALVSRPVDEIPAK